MKDKVIFVLLGVAISFLLAVNSVSALGVSPSSFDINFEPNSVHTFSFDVFHATPGRKVNVYAEGALAQYVSLDNTAFYNEGKVKVTIKLPSKIGTSGKNIIYITAKEEPPQNEFIGTAVAVRVTVVIHVPYPGKYIESALKVPDANIGEKVPVELKVTSRGTENVTVSPVINFYDSSMNQVDKFIFVPEQMATNDYDYFRRYLNTNNMEPDNYLAEAVIDYGGLTQKINATFKVGNLYVNVTDFTKNITAEEINKFVIKVESNWNGDISGVYADVKLLNDTFETSFSTPPISLKAWEEKNLTGYFEAKGLKGGNYKVEITLHYMGQTTFASGDLFVTGKNKMNIPLIVGSIIAVLIIFVGAYLIIKRLKKPKHKRRR
jgi:hypothetical protein